MIIEKRELAGGLSLDFIRSDRFLFSLLAVTLKLGKLSLREKKALFVLSAIMERSNSESPTTAEYDTALEMLYSPVISFGFSEERDGEVLFTVGADFAGGKVFGEELFSSVIDFLECSLYRPAVLTEHFPRVLAETLDFIRGNLLADSGDPETLAGSRFGELSLAYSKGIEHPLSLEERLTIPDTVSAEDVLEIYEKLAQAPAVYAFFIGKEDSETVSAGIERLFPRRERLLLSEYSPSRGESVSECDGPIGNMTRISLGFSYDGERETGVLLAGYLGGSPQSRLFAVLREEKRYCYSVEAYNCAPSMIGVFATVEARVEKEAKECILSVIEEAKREIFEEEFRAAIQNARLALSEVYDSRMLIEASCNSAFLGYRDEPFALEKKLPTITKEKLSECARSLRLSVDYTCRGKELPLTKKGYTKGEWIPE